MSYRRLSCVVTLVCTSIVAHAIEAQEAQKAATAAGVAPPSAAKDPPSFLSPQHRLAPHEIATKTPGTYGNGLPIVDVDPDTGWGFGAVGNVFWDGERSDPFFTYTPYRQRLGAQAFVTTSGLQQHFIDYDAPYLADTPFRLRANVGYERNTSASYFGRGIATLGRLSYPGANRTYRRIRDYLSALREIGPDGITHTLYNKYDLEDPALRVSVERTFLRGLVRVQAGLGLSYVRIRDYSGTTTSGDDPAHGKSDVRAIQSTTHLREDCLAGRIVGCAGGLNNTLKLGVALDTRDYEPDPNSGVFVDLTGEFSSRVFGSAFDYARVTLATRGFVSPFPSFTDLVIAGRAVYSMQTAGTPFFSMSTLAFTDMDRQGLGGLWSLRGYRQERFVGRVVGLANLEVRWTFLAFDVLSQHIALSVVPFFDVGRVFERVGEVSSKNWRTGSGGALHIAWNDATIINFTLGVSSEGTELYMDLGNQF